MAGQTPSELPAGAASPGSCPGGELADPLGFTTIHP